MTCVCCGTAWTRRPRSPVLTAFFRWFFRCHEVRNSDPLLASFETKAGVPKYGRAQEHKSTEQTHGTVSVFLGLSCTTLYFVGILLKGNTLYKLLVPDSGKFEPQKSNTTHARSSYIDDVCCAPATRHRRQLAAVTVPPAHNGPFADGCVLRLLHARRVSAFVCRGE